MGSAIHRARSHFPGNVQRLSRLMLPFYLSILALIFVSLSFVWLLVKDRNFWRDKYQARDKEAREREQHLFDQMLRLKGFRATVESNTPTPHVRKSFIDPEEMEIIESR